MMLLGGAGSVVTSIFVPSARPVPLMVIRHMGGGFVPHAEGHPMMDGMMPITRMARLGLCFARRKTLQKDQNHDYDARKVPHRTVRKLALIVHVDGLYPRYLRQHPSAPVDCSDSHKVVV